MPGLCCGSPARFAGFRRAQRFLPPPPSFPVLAPQGFGNHERHRGTSALALASIGKGVSRASAGDAIASHVGSRDRLGLRWPLRVVPLGGARRGCARARVSDRPFVRAACRSPRRSSRWCGSSARRLRKRPARSRSPPRRRYERAGQRAMSEGEEDGSVVPAGGRARIWEDSGGGEGEKRRALGRGCVGVKVSFGVCGSAWRRSFLRRGDCRKGAQGRSTAKERGASMQVCLCSLTSRLGARRTGTGVRCVLRVMVTFSLRRPRARALTVHLGLPPRYLALTPSFGRRRLLRPSRAIDRSPLPFPTLPLPLFFFFFPLSLPLSL